MKPLRRLTLDESNRIFTAAVVGGGGVLGSVISFLVGGAVLVNPVHLYLGKFALTRDRAVLAIGAAFAFFYLAEGLASVANYSDPRSLFPLVANVPFLGIVMIFSRIAMSKRGDILTAIEAGVVIGAIAGFIYAAIQTAFLGYPRAEGLAGNPGPFGLVNAVLYGWALVMAVSREGPRRVVALVAAAAAAGAMLLSEMRTMWPMLIIGLLIPAILFRSRFRSIAAGRMLLVAAAALVLVAALAYPIVERRLSVLADDYSLITEKGDYDNALGQRLLIWQIGYELGLEKPILGHGSKHTPDLIKERTSAADGPKLEFSHFHNFLLNAWVSSGILGMAAIVALLLTPVWVMARRRRDATAEVGFALMLVLTASFLTSGLFNIMLGHDILDALYVYGTIAACVLVFGSDDGPVAAKSKVLSRPAPVA